ncbi:LysR family transcriptional regulator [Chromobacterium sp. ATCC 53434]|uniref:LysR family transcriptional regulator n=1 Tax=Chromobacterium sp. (strain ATCC 53434 / SC 14030) TaxID=2059672 RepID=UPI000C7951FB|nr:LysR family transcriptional regulator [Chromobacterium sp. ATCC 53434]AUH52946.1 LysR family transcriptional regulator [Chromobacterium sp. ATCC 53434]
MDQNHFLGIREFVAIAQTGSFTAAAEMLGITGSALSKRIMRLETRLGSKLLHRTTRRVSLSSQGEVYLASCLRAIATLEDAENYLDAGQQEPVGRVHINLPAAFGRRHVLPILLDLSARHEGLDLSITFSERMVDLIGNGIDLAVRIGRLTDNADLVARQLGEQHLLICGSPAYIARKGMPHAKEDLLRHNCLIDWRRGARHAWHLRNAAGIGEAFDIPVRHEVGDGEAILAATLAGRGLAQLPTWLAHQHLQSGELIPVLHELSGETMPIHVVWPRTHYMHPRMRTIVDTLLRAAQAPGSRWRWDAPPGAA